GGRRALLKARLAEMSGGGRSNRGIFDLIARRLAPRRILTVAFASVALAIFLMGILVRNRLLPGVAVVQANDPIEPLPNLTPGAVRLVTARDVCGGNIADDPSVRTIPASLAQEVFREYGMDANKAKNYEVDFLITPELGGSNDIRNLWPE